MSYDSVPSFVSVDEPALLIKSDKKWVFDEVPVIERMSESNKHSSLI